MAFDGTLKFDTAIDKAGFKTGLSGLGDLAKSGLSGVGSIAKAGMAAVTGAVTAASGAVLALGKNAVSVGSDFESGMSQVIATMGITKDTVQDGVNSFDLLSQAAKDAGANTTFSATEAAGALNYLALAGYDAATAADSLDAVLNLAAAGGLDLAYASDLATDAMAALGIEAGKENLTHFGDQMAVTASKSNTSVAQLGEAILTVGGTAKSLSGGVSEMNAALGVLANRGIKGAEGGTALRNMILSLTAPTDKAAAKLDELGVKVLDDAGNMRSLNDVFRDLDKALSGVSDGEKTQILNDIFNKVDLKSAQAMLAGAGSEFTSLRSAIGDCDGAMQQMADTMNDTLEGDIKSLQSKAEALGITVYESMNLPLRDLAQLGGQYLGQLKDAFEAGGFDGAAQALGGMLGDAVTHIGDYLPDVTGIGASIVTSLISGISDNSSSIIQQGLDMGLTLLQGAGDISVRFLELGANLLTSLADGIDGKKLRIKRILRETLRNSLEAINENLPDILEAGGEIVETLGGALLENLPLLLEIGESIIGTITNAVSDPETLQMLVGAAVTILTLLGTSLMNNMPLLLSAAVQIIVSLVEALSDPDNLNGLLDTGLLILMTLLTALTDNFEPLLAAAILIVEALGTYLAEHADDLIETGLELLTKLLDGIFEHTDDIFLAAEKIIDALYDELCNEETMAKIFDLGVKLLAKLLEGLVKIGAEGAGFALDLMQNIQEHLMSVDWKQLGKDLLKSILDGMTDYDMGLLDDFKNNWLSGIKDIFGIHSPSKLMRDQIGKNLALGVEVGFDENIPDTLEIPSRFELTRPQIDPAALEALRMSPMPDASSLVPQSATSIVNNSYQYNNSSSTTNSMTTNQTPERSAPTGDIIIPVQIGGESVETLVITAAQIANARSGGATI